ncbi:DNA internalization-related competence protein ComEC/Rec2 [Candidatus Enterococcus huntleyi]|uniref:DNA internalization-related competence protein ComEC/Rec2 n=1 Tax=Candidatus Enterococcus huntleyi TaxID=1857217 RepID=UPI00137A65D7|nr:DNA internalization-related competence protein ComEC/Rec2 [Enterococcus sp. JM4C]
MSYFLESVEEKETWLDHGKDYTGLLVSGELTEGEPQRNLNGFDERRFQQITGLSGKLQITTYKRQTIKRTFNDWFRYFRATGIQQAAGGLSKKVASYVNALLFNYKNEQFQEIQTIFSTSGLLHLFSLSGMHVQVYLGCLYFLLRRGGLVPNQSFSLLMIASFFLLILSGFGLSVLRAITTFMLKFFMKKQQIRLSNLDYWSLTCLFLLILQPYLFFQTAGQLTMGVTFIMTIMEDFPAKWISAKKLISSMGIGFLSLPIVLGTFYEIPLLSGVLTYFISPIFKWYLLPSVVLAFCASFVPKWFTIPLLLFEHSLTLLETGIKFVGNETIRSGKLQLWQIIPLILVGLFSWQFFCQKNWRPFILCFFIFLTPFFAKYLNPQGMIAFVDVGQGDSIYFQSPFHEEIILLDTGGKLGFKKEAWQERPQKSSSEYNVIPFLKSQGVSTIDKLILTHGDEDHMGEWLVIAQKFKIKELVIPIGIQIKPKIKRGVELFKKAGTKITELKMGQKIEGDFDFSVLSPAVATDGGNENSLVLGLQLNHHRFLFTGDLGKTGEQELLSNYPTLKIDVLKVGHHGSKNSSSEAFIQQIQPKIGVISCGKDNRFGHPNQEVLTRLATQSTTIFRTDLQGMIYYQWWTGVKREEFRHLINED